MGYWEEVRDVLKKGYDIALDEMKSGAETVISTSKKGVTYAQYKKDLFFEHRKLHELLADLGDITHDLYKEKKDIYADDRIKEIISKVIEVEADCQKIEKEMESL
ncbi:MAG: hypothetical protein OEZ13_03510 [Spirochaetia bacterium]|nr:hypothetical protein [Spirochaetia bacterium]